MNIVAVASISRPLVAARSGGGVSDAFSTFVSADYTPDADGTTATTLTFTAKNANDDPVTGVSVTYA